MVQIVYSHDHMNVVQLLWSCAPDQVVMSLITHIGLAVVTLCKSLYSYCSSLLSCKIRDLDLAKVAKKPVSSSPISSLDLGWSKSDFGCQHHTRDTVSVPVSS